MADRLLARALPRLLVPLMLAVAACEAPDPAPKVEPPVPAEPRTPTLVVAMPPVDDRTLAFRLTAPPDQPIYLDNCNGAFSWGLEHLVSGAWKPAWIVTTNGCHSDPIEIAAGESRIFREGISLQHGESLAADRYRIAVYGLYRTRDHEGHAATLEVPGELRASEPFRFGPLGPP